MKKVALTDLDPRLQKQITAAEQQLKSNPQYAIEILSGILSRNLGCIEVRRILRKAQKVVLGTRKGLFDGITSAITSGSIAKAVEKDPVAAIAEAETAHPLRLWAFTSALDAMMSNRTIRRLP